MLPDLGELHLCGFSATVLVVVESSLVRIVDDAVIGIGGAAAFMEGSPCQQSLWLRLREDGVLEPDASAFL